MRYATIKEDVEVVSQHLGCGVKEASKSLVNMISLHSAAWNAHKNIAELPIANGV
jgi:hypothetical protein